MQGKYTEIDNLHKKVHFGSFRAFREFWKSTVTFSGQDNTGYLFEVDFKTVRRFRKPFRIPTHFVGEPPQLAAQPPLAVAKNKLQTSIYFPFLLLLNSSIIIVCLFILFYYLIYLVLLSLLILLFLLFYFNSFSFLCF
jgi:hypothetical protein